MSCHFWCPLEKDSEKPGYGCCDIYSKYRMLTKVREHNDPFVGLADQATESLSLATASGGFLVDLILDL